MRTILILAVLALLGAAPVVAAALGPSSFLDVADSAATGASAPCDALLQQNTIHLERGATFSCRTVCAGVDEQPMTCLTRAAVGTGYAPPPAPLVRPAGPLGYSTWLSPDQRRSAFDEPTFSAGGPFGSFLI